MHDALGAHRAGCDIVLCRLDFRLRRLSGHVAETPRGPGLTRSGHLNRPDLTANCTGVMRGMRSDLFT